MTPPSITQVFADYLGALVADDEDAAAAIVEQVDYLSTAEAGANPAKASGGAGPLPSTKRPPSATLPPSAKPAAPAKVGRGAGPPPSKKSDKKKKKKRARQWRQRRAAAVAIQAVARG